MIRLTSAHILYNMSTTLYSLQLYSSSTVYNLYNTPLSTWSTWSAVYSLMYPRGSVAKKRGKSGRTEGSG